MNDVTLRVGAKIYNAYGQRKSCCVTPSMIINFILSSNARPTLGDNTWMGENVIVYIYSEIRIKNHILGGSYGVTNSLFTWKVLTILT